MDKLIQPRKRTLLEQTKKYDAENLRIALEALADPDRMPHLNEWARVVVLRLKPDASIATEHNP